MATATQTALRQRGGAAEGSVATKFQEEKKERVEEDVSKKRRRRPCLVKTCKVLRVILIGCSVPLATLFALPRILALKRADPLQLCPVSKDLWHLCEPPEDPLPGEWKHYIFTLYIGFLFVFHFAKASFSDPGFVKGNEPHDGEGHFAVALPSSSGMRLRYGKRWCEDCQLWKPPRAYHCIGTNRCVHRLSHWCGAIWTSVGVNNMGHYLCMCVVALVGLTYCLYLFISTGWIIYLAMRDHFPDELYHHPARHVAGVVMHILHTNIEAVVLDLVLMAVHMDLVETLIKLVLTIVALIFVLQTLPQIGYARRGITEIEVYADLKNRADERILLEDGTQFPVPHGAYRRPGGSWANMRMVVGSFIPFVFPCAAVADPSEWGACPINEDTLEAIKQYTGKAVAKEEL